MLTECDRCEGRGYVFCHDCPHPDIPTQCSTCKGDGFDYCDYCDGDGLVTIDDRPMVFLENRPRGYLAARDRVDPKVENDEFDRKSDELYALETGK